MPDLWPRFCGRKEDELAAFANSLDEKGEQKSNIAPSAGVVTQENLSENGDKDNLGISSDGADTNLSADKNDAETTLTEDAEKTSAAGGANEAGAASGNETSQTAVRKRRKHKRKQQEVPDVKKDENGELEIDTTDVTYFEGAKQPYGAKSARGERDDEKFSGGRYISGLTCI